MSNLIVVKTVDNSNPNIGDNITFTVGLSNYNFAPTLNVVVQDLLPSGYTFVSATTIDGTYDYLTGIWNIGTLGSVHQPSLSITVQVECSGTYNNTATLITPVQSSDNTATVQVTPNGPFCNSIPEKKKNMRIPYVFCVDRVNNGAKVANIIHYRGMVYRKISDNGTRCCYVINNYTLN